MLKLPVLIEPMFQAAGWSPSESYLSVAQEPSHPADVARSIIQEFRGLRVGECCAGTEWAASDVQFFTGMRPPVAEGDAPWWRGAVGEMWAFAHAHREHMVLFAGPGRRFYIFTEPDERLYEGGTDFGELMRKLLWGYKFGAEVPRDA
jgi:hypothetical protein